MTIFKQFSDPNCLGSHSEVSHNPIVGYVSINQLKEGLQNIGANLSHEEFNNIIKKVTNVTLKNCIYSNGLKDFL